MAARPRWVSSVALQTPLTLLMVGAVVATGFIAPSAARDVTGNAQATSPGGQSAGSAGAGSTAPGAAVPGRPGAPAAPGGPGGPSNGGSGASATVGGPTGSGAGAPAAAGTSGANGSAPAPTAGAASASASNVDVVLGDYTVSSASSNTFGLTPVFSSGSYEGARRAVTDYINSTGGFGGHRVVWKVETVSDSGSQQADSNAACTTLTEDDHVFAVFNGLTNNDFSNLDCYARHKTLVMDESMYNGDQDYYRGVAPYVQTLLFPTADRSAAAQVAGLKQLGYFSDSGEKLGVVVTDEPVYRRVYSNFVVPGLAGTGAGQPDAVYVTPGDGSTSADGNLISQLNSAVAKFEVDGVNHVIFVGGAAEGTAGNVAVFFMVQAEKQKFTPRYGVTSADAPWLETSDVPRDQLQNAVGVGVLPFLDTYDGQYAPYPSTPAEQQCYAIGKAENQQQSTRYNNAAVLEFCDVMLTMQRAAKGLTGPGLTREALAQSIDSLGTSDPLSIPDASSWQPGRYDASSGYRLLKYDDSCGCASGQNTDGNPGAYVYVDRAIRAIPSAE